MYVLAFNDTVSEVEMFDLHIAPHLNPKAPAPRPKGNPVHFRAWVYGEGKAGPFVNHTVGRRATETFKPNAALGRKLKVEVTPEEVVAFWEGEEVARITAAQMAEDAERLAPELQEGTLPGASGERPRIQFSVRGGLGLYISYAVASFREVVVEPLDARP
jgi:hypothetical protein